MDKNSLRLKIIEFLTRKNIFDFQMFTDISEIENAPLRIIDVRIKEDGYKDNFILTVLKEKETNDIKSTFCIYYLPPSDFDKIFFWKKRTSYLEKISLLETGIKKNVVLYGFIYIDSIDNKSRYLQMKTFGNILNCLNKIKNHTHLLEVQGGIRINISNNINHIDYIKENLNDYIGLVNHESKASLHYCLRNNFHEYTDIFSLRSLGKVFIKDE